MDPTLGLQRSLLSPRSRVDAGVTGDVMSLTTSALEFGDTYNAPLYRRKPAEEKRFQLRQLLSVETVEPEARIIQVSYLNELSPKYMKELGKFNKIHLPAIQEGERKPTVVVNDNAKEDTLASQQKVKPSAVRWNRAALAYFVLQMGCMYLWLLPGKVIGVVLLGVIHAVAFALLTRRMIKLWYFKDKFIIVSAKQQRIAIAVYTSVGLVYLIVPLWVYLVSEQAQDPQFLWISAFAILGTDFLFLCVIVGLWMIFNGPIHIAGLSASLFYLYLMMNVCGMMLGGYIGGIMHTAPSRHQDWLTFGAKGCAQVVYINFFLQAACVFRSFSDPLFASEWWLNISRNHSSQYVPISSIHIHMILNIVNLVAWVVHTILHVFRYKNFHFWENILFGCRGAKPPPQMTDKYPNSISYAVYFCPDMYYYLITGAVLGGLFLVQSIFSSMRRRLACMQYLRVWHKPVSMLIYIVFVFHARAAFVLVFLLFQLIDEMVSGWKLLKIKEIKPYFHTIDKNGSKLNVASVMNLILNYRCDCVPGNYAFLRLMYPNAPFEAVPFTIVGGSNGDRISFNIEINLGRSRVATTWFNDIFGLGPTKFSVDLDDVKVAMFGPFASTPKPMTAYKNVIVVTQGIGITPGAAIFKCGIRDAIKHGIRKFQSITVFWSNSRDKRAYEDEMVHYNEDNEIDKLFEEPCCGNVVHNRQMMENSESEFNRSQEYTWAKRDGPLTNCSDSVFINLVISGGGRGRFTPAFFYKEFTQLKQMNGGQFGVFCCGKAMCNQMNEVKPIFEGVGFEFHNETF